MIHSDDGPRFPFTSLDCQYVAVLPSTALVPSWAVSCVEDTLTGWFKARFTTGWVVGVGVGAVVDVGVGVGGGLEATQSKAEDKSRRP